MSSTFTASCGDAMCHIQKIAVVNRAPGIEVQALMLSPGVGVNLHLSDPSSRNSFVYVQKDSITNDGGLLMVCTPIQGVLPLSAVMIAGSDHL
jgi:hypothetical protein